VNEHEFITDSYDTPDYEVNVHNVDTPFDELLVNETHSFPRNNNRPRKVMMNIETWKSLSKQDQDGWDTMSDDGKRKILEYAKTRGAPSEDPQRRIANTHEFKILDHLPSKQASTRFLRTTRTPLGLKG
jgi:hypothetical protein